MSSKLLMWMRCSEYTPDGPVWVFEEASNLIGEGVVKVDHFENIYRLPKKFEGSPNWRQARGGYKVVGSGQSTLAGLRSILKYYVEEMGLKKVIFINMRSEPVVYANNFSYGPRNPHNLNENIEINGLSTTDVECLQHRLVDVLRKHTRESSNGFTYHKDTYALVPEDREDYVCSEPCDSKNILSVNEAYDKVKSEFSTLEVKFFRLPVNDERVPNLEDFDRLVQYLKAELDNSTGVHFNCQMGKGRTTTGMVLACLITAKLMQQPIGLESSGSNGDSSTESSANKPGTLENGEFQIINNLCSALSSKTMKAEMDFVLDACDHMQNLRKCIWETKVQYDKEMSNPDKEAGERRATFWKKLGVNFIERYFYLILFNVYCTEQVPQSFKVSFVDWCGEKQDLIEILGTREKGPLSTFDWV
ncbi:paladin-like isoform X2 [Convolutriloba macropyga]|uniref:paladin-like isoform X2 n=1 Tax=Convolutriloba macropyga TaxID=536237 RepID=UPI003F52500A